MPNAGCENMKIAYKRKGTKLMRFDTLSKHPLGDIKQWNLDSIGRVLF